MELSEKAKHMTEAANQLASMIQKRLGNRIEMLNTLGSNAMENVPDEVKKMREEESSKLRAVIQEQKDIVEIIKMLFPGA